MGTKVAPTYATLVMGFLEDRMYSKIHEHFTESADDIINSWRRFIDDCFIIWKAEYGDHNTFFEILNDLHSSIKFTRDIGGKELSFLDVFIKIDSNNIIETDIYRKPTDSMNYVPFTSAHPKHVIKNIPYNLAYRISRIVSNTNRKNERFNELQQRLTQLKYPESLIKDAIRKANINNIEERQNKPSVKIIPFIQDFNKNNPRIFESIIKPTTSTLKMVDPFKNVHFLSAFRQPKSILSILRKNNRRTIYGVSKCNEPRCKCCDILLCGATLDFEIPDGNKKTFNIKSNMDCCSSNLIYKLICNKCNAYYIGQTGDVLRNRVTVHRQQILHQHYSFLKVSLHIRQCGKGFSLMPFFLLPPDCGRLHRESKEAYFISMFHPMLNSD
jgi:hypothetical protein